MNNTQTVFALFFAIHLGTAANVQPRWKAFNWPLASKRVAGKRLSACVRRRLSLATLSFTIAPLLFFGFGFCRLAGRSTDTAIEVVFHGAVPALAAFAFYRLWVSTVQFKPEWYYGRQTDLPPALYSKTSPSDPTLDDLNLNLDRGLVQRCALINLLVGIVYIIVSLFFLLVPLP